LQRAVSPLGSSAYVSNEAFALRGSAGVEFTVGDEKRGYGGDGHALVFDDSFELEVWHGGDRYVILALLKQPDA